MTKYITLLLIQNHDIIFLLRYKVLKQIIEENSQFLTFFPSIFTYQIFKPGFIRITKVKIFNNFQKVFKSYYIIPLFIFISINLFDLILKGTLITFSIQNIFNYLLFFVINKNKRWGFIDLINQRVCKYFLKQIRIKNIMNFYLLRQL